MNVVYSGTLVVFDGSCGDGSKVTDGPGWPTGGSVTAGPGGGVEFVDVVLVDSVVVVSVLLECLTLQRSLRQILTALRCRWM